MVLEISSTLLARLLSEAEQNSDREVCGLLFGTSTHILESLSCGNVAPDPRTAFEIDPATLIAAHKAEREGGSTIIGCYHSHPVGPPLPSSRDAAAAMPDGSIWLVIAGAEAGFFRATEGGPIEGRFIALRHQIAEP